MGMVTLMLDSTRLEIVLSAGERALAFRTRNVIIPRDVILRVQLTDDPWTWLRGVRAGGTYIPRTLAAGTWRSAAGDDFALIRRRRPGVVVDLSGHDEFERVVLSTRHGAALAKALRWDVADEPADVADLAAARPSPAA